MTLSTEQLSVPSFSKCSLRSQSTVLKPSTGKSPRVNKEEREKEEARRRGKWEREGEGRGGEGTERKREKARGGRGNRTGGST